MTRLFPIFFLLIISSGCASLLGTRTESITINTSHQATVVVNRDTAKDCMEANFKVLRNPAELKVEIISDTINKTLFVEAGKNPVYWLNLNPYPTFFLGFLVDLKTPKKYSYPRNLYIDMEDKETAYTIYKPWPDNNKWGLHVSFPTVNLFYFKPNLGSRAVRNLGIGGMSIGLDQYHKPFQFINYAIGLNTNYFQRIESFSDNPVTITNISLSVSNNHKAKNIIAGYGLSLIHHDRETADFYRFDAFEQIDGIDNTNYVSLGFIFPVYIQAGKNFIIGLNYQPSFVRWGDIKTFGYSYQLGLEMGWKFKLK